MATLLMHSYITDNFLLENKWSERLYHEFAAQQPIVDFHSRMNPRWVAEDAHFPNCTPVWLESDPLKWRAMRTLGVPETFIGGEASDLEKFRHWAAIVPYLMGNPLYHFTHLELFRYFEYDQQLDAENAEEAFELTRDKLQLPSHSTLGLLAQRKVEVLVTAMDPAESLAFHRTYSSRKDRELLLLPGFRPEGVFRLDSPGAYRAYMDKLGTIAHTTVESYDDLLQALKNRALDFNELGCRSADHELGRTPPFESGTYSVEKIFAKIMAGSELEPAEQEYFQFETRLHLCRIYNELGWVQQFHMGRTAVYNQRAARLTGSPTGFEGLVDVPETDGLRHLLSILDREDELTRTVLYPSNSSVYESLAELAGSFNDGQLRAKVQLSLSGSQQFNKEDIDRLLAVWSNYSVLSSSIGMPSYSRSPLSYCRYEYFRRILCNRIGTGISRGELPEDVQWLGAIVSDICYDNSKNYFNI